MTKVTVIMLTCDREGMVSRAIESVLAQTLRGFEFVIVDNGSADASGRIADEYAARDPRIRVIHRQRGNIGSGRNAGLDAAAGEYIAFIDDDDYCEPDFLEFLYGLAEEYGADVSICGSAHMGTGEKMVMTAEEAVMALLKRKMYNVAFPTKMVRASLFAGRRFSESSKYDDIWLMPRILGGADRVAYHGLPKYTFVRHDGNNSAWTTDMSLLNAETLDEYLSAYRGRAEWLISDFPASAPAWRYFEWSFMISMIEKIDRLGIKGCARQYEAMVRELRDNKDEFLTSGLIMDFEKEWMGRYVG